MTSENIKDQMKLIFDNALDCIRIHPYYSNLCSEYNLNNEKMFFFKNTPLKGIHLSVPKNKSCEILSLTSGIKHIKYFNFYLYVRISENRNELLRIEEAVKTVLDFFTKEEKIQELIGFLQVKKDSVELRGHLRNFEGIVITESGKDKAKEVLLKFNGELQDP